MKSLSKDGLFLFKGCMISPKYFLLIETRILKDFNEDYRIIISYLKWQIIPVERLTNKMNKIRTFVLNKRTFLLVISIFFLWYTIDSLYGYLVTEQKLQSFTGKIETFNVKAGTGKRKDSICVIVLNSYPNHNFETKDLRLVQNKFTPKLKGGDSITIYIIPRLFKSTKRSSILKITKDGHVILNNYQITKNVSRNLFFIFGVLFLLVFLPYVLGIKKIIAKSKLN